MPDARDPYAEFEKLVEELIIPGGNSQAPVGHKIDLLERLIEQWRIERHELSNGIDFEEFLLWKWLADSDAGQLHFARNEEEIADYRDSGTRPLRLQRKLLVFLLLHHGEYDHVLDIIRAFVAKISSDLDVRDFKKTETGVFRCFTNTRFAANKLRDYGLLKYTRQERFKVWVLSLPGIVVAAKALQQPNWSLPPTADPWHGLDSVILQTLEQVREFSALVEGLTAICTPNVTVFDTFDSVLREAHKILLRYLQILENDDLSAAERHKNSTDAVESLENVFGYTEFIEEFITSIQIEKLLQQADAAAAASRPTP